IISYVSKGYHFEIYTLFSGTILNIAHLDNVKLFSVRTKFLNDEFSNIYEVFTVNNITVIDV
ncbi:hypothetical protein, partial [Ursidibacter maritimus]